jgi:molybdopterin molybdotransferase
MTSFFKVKKPEEVLRIIELFGPAGEELIPLEDALGRVLSKALAAPEDLPGFRRSSMDGYAVRAKDTFGATESLPALVKVTGEVQMGQIPGRPVGEGQAVKISTGGMLPEGADGVVMVEYCHLIDEKTLEVNRAISPLENVIQPGDDFRAGEAVLPSGSRLRPQDLGVMAGLGQTQVSVFRRPRVAVLSTGDEVVAVQEQPGPGQVRDINRYTLGAFCQKYGAIPIYLGRCHDEFSSLKATVEVGLEKADAVWISGGSSVGTRDLTLQVFESLSVFELLVHGISISPGKPTIIGRFDSKPIIGLPGHVASALVVAEIFLAPLIFRLSGQKDFRSGGYELVEAELSRNIESASGREDYIRVKLRDDRATMIAEPIFGKSGLISTLVEADGLLRIDMYTEGLYQGQKVMVMRFRLSEGGCA